MMEWVVNTIDKDIKTRYNQLKNKQKARQLPKVLIIKPFPKSNEIDQYEYHKEACHSINRGLEKVLKDKPNMIAININSFLPNDKRMFYGHDLSSVVFIEMWNYVDEFIKNRLDEALWDKARSTETSNTESNTPLHPARRFDRSRYHWTNPKRYPLMGDRNYKQFC